MKHLTLHSVLYPLTCGNLACALLQRSLLELLLKMTSLVVPHKRNQVWHTGLLQHERLSATCESSVCPPYWLLLVPGETHSYWKKKCMKHCGTSSFTEESRFIQHVASKRQSSIRSKASLSSASFLAVSFSCCMADENLFLLHSALKKQR